MAKLVAVDGCTFKFTDASGAPANAMITVTAQPSQKSKAEGKGVYKIPLTFTLATVMTSKITNGDGATTAPGSMPSTAQKTKADGVLVMLEGDKVDVPVIGHSGNSTASDVVTVEIAVAGQTKAKGS